MDFLTKKRWAITIFVLLIGLNLVTLGFLWLERLKPPGPPPPGFQNQLTPHFLRNELNLSEEQLRSFGEVRRSHFEERRNLSWEMRELRQKLAKNIFNDNVDPKIIDADAKKLSQLYYQREIQMFEHFHELKSFLTPEQSQKFSLMLQEALQRSGGPHFEGRGGMGKHRRWQRREHGRMQNPPRQPNPED